MRFGQPLAHPLEEGNNRWAAGLKKSVHGANIHSWRNHAQGNRRGCQQQRRGGQFMVGHFQELRCS